MRYLIGCDFGGGASKATLLGEDGRIAAEASSEYATSYPRPGWAEQDPEDSVEAFVRNIRALFVQSGIKPEKVAAIALDGATHTAVLLDGEDRVIRPAIYWTDQRSIKEAEELKEKYADRIRQLTLNAPGALWTLPQLMWLAGNEPEHFSRIRKILSMKDYVRYRLTGDYVTDRIEACGFMLYDVACGEWSEELCGLAGIDRTILPRVVDSRAVLSPPGGTVGAACGLSPKTKVIAGATDTVMEVYASGAICPGQATVKLATAGRICVVTPEALVDENLVCYPHICPGLWYPGTATKSCAASFRWYRDTFGSASYEKLSREAEAVELGSQGLFFHPYLQGELTPYQDETLRGSFTGIRSYHTRAHFTRAVLEGVAYSLKDCLASFRETGAEIRQAGIIGGGAKGALWRQIVADMLQIPLTKAECDDSSLGSAMLAGVACGVFGDFRESVKRCVRPVGINYPNPKNAAFYEREFVRYQKIHDCLAEVYHLGE